jgi:hypothetical protein
MNPSKIMPRGRIDKVLMTSYIYKLKSEIHDGKYSNNDEEWRDGAQYVLSRLLDKLNEYSG